MTNQSFDLRKKVAEFFEKNLLKFESFSLIFIAFGLFLKAFLIQVNSVILVLFGSFLACVYFFGLGLSPMYDDNLNNIEKFFKPLIGCTCTVITIGILFKLQLWTGCQQILQVGLLSIIVIFILFLYFKIRSDDLVNLRNINIIRPILIGAIGLFFLLIPEEMIRIPIYKNDKEIIALSLNQYYEDSIKNNEA